MINKLILALEYLDRGWSVIPVHPTKIPAIVWKEYQSRRATKEEIINLVESIKKILD